MVLDFVFKPVANFFFNFRPDNHVENHYYHSASNNSWWTQPGGGYTPRCKDGSLNMSFAVNRGFDKYSA